MTNLNFIYKSKLNVSQVLAAVHLIFFSDQIIHAEIKSSI